MVLGPDQHGACLDPTGMRMRVARIRSGQERWVGREDQEGGAAACRALMAASTCAHARTHADGQRAR
eukprot:414129-Rhodomonas_salina.2